MGYFILRSRSFFIKGLKTHTFFITRRNAHQLDVVKTDGSSEVLNKKLSTLYVPGRRGADVYQIVKPLIDVEFISQNIEALRQSCRLRGLATQLDLDQLVPNLRLWEALKNEYASLVEREREYVTQLKTLKSSGTDYEELNKEYTDFIINLRSAKTKLHDIEDQVLPDVQLIPNFVDALTPPEEDTVLRQDPIDNEFPSVSHKEIGTRMELLRFSDTSPSAYYLLGELSELEHATHSYFAERLKYLGLSPLACPDFCKSFICEAVGSDPHSRDECITLRPPKDNDRETAQKHIVVGSSSFDTFCAYFTNMNVNESNLPLRYFSQGRSYNACHRNAKLADLFSVVQSSSIHCLMLCKESHATAEFDNLFAHVESCYASFKIPRRIVEVSARNLNLAESRRKRLELWSPSQKRFIPVAHVSQRRDFVSKRLHVTYGEEYHAMGYCSMVEGRAVCLPVLIGCILENYQTPNHTFDFCKTLEFLHEYIYD